ncbi:MAG: DUF6544 family protein [Arachnia sp.]
MDNFARWILVAVLVVHGLIHFLGVAKGFGWASVPQLKEPISAGMAVVWLSGGVLVLAAAALIAATAPSWWWGVALMAALVSQVAIITSWGDAKVGTVVNVILLVVATFGFLSAGPFSFAARWNAQADAALEQQSHAALPILTESDLESLPHPLADYIRASGAVGKPRTTNFSADFHGRIRSAPDTAWMPFTGKQLNTYGENPQRLFLMHARRSGLPVQVLHLFHDATATMQVKLLAAFPIVDAKGPEMDRAETVTVFNDLVALAPGAIIDAPIQWTPVDAHWVHGLYTLGHYTVSATLVFDDRHDLVDFISPDRSRASDDGISFTPQEWSTPLLRHRDVDGRRVLTLGEARWRSPDSEPHFTYLELHLDAIAFDVATSTSCSETSSAFLVGGH